MKKLITLLLLVPCLISLGQETLHSDYNCFTVMVGKNASVEGTLLYGHNDDDGFQLVNTYVEPRKNYPQGAEQTLQYGGRIPQVRTTHKFLWLEVPGMEVADGFMNEYGVCIGSNFCGSREDTLDISHGGILYDLRLIMAQRAKTAREAVRIAGSLIEQFGYRGSGRSYCISDREEAWVLAAVKGKRWAAARVPDDEVMVLPNYYPIAEMDLKDTANYLGSADLISYAQHRGWYDRSSDGKFNFRNAYASKGALKNRGNTGRAWSAYSALEEDYRRNDNFPFSFKPKKKVSKQILMELLAGHSQGMQDMDKTESCTTGNPYELNEGMICNGGTIYSFVVESRPWMPVDIGTVMWLAPRRCDVQPFIPWYCGVTRVPENYAKKGYLNTLQDHYTPPLDIHVMSKDLAYWNFEVLSANINKDFVQKFPVALLKKQQMEASLLKAQGKFEKRALRQYRINPTQAIQTITKYSNQHATKSYLQTVALLTELNIPFPTPETKAIKIEDEVPTEKN
ncbi:MAG: C69 family dipeptidase [Phycisphaeraceae bacterium]|nr:C69 family dipeptidase [Phycisphaeraceae bacterium]